MAGPWDEFSGKPWEDYGKPGSIADFPNAPGFVSTVKRTAGQMLTTGATSIEDLTGPNAATAAVRRVGQGVIDNNPAGIQSIGDIADSPWLTVKEAVGQFVPQVGAAAAGAAGGAAIGRRVAGAPGAAIGAGIGSLAPIFSQEYGGIREDQKEAGQEDKGRALLAAGAATALERVGMGKLLKGLRGEMPPMAKIPAEIAKGFAKEGATEAAQTAIEQVGAFKDPTTSESMQEQALAGVMGGIGGGVLGGVHAGAQKAFGKTKSAETADSADLEQSPAAAPPAPATPQAIRAQKLPETGPLSGAVNAGIEAQAQGLEAATGQQPLTEDEMAAAQFYVEQRRQDGTPAGQRFAAEFDAGRVSPREALEGFRLSQSPEFALPQPGVDAAEIDPAAAGALVAPGALPQAELLPVGQATEVPVDVAEPAAPIEEPRAARTPGAEGQTIDPRSPNAVAQYVDRVRAINTPAARAFVQDFEAGRITPADVMQLVAPGQENADANLQTARRALGLKDVAGTQAPDGTRLLGPDGLPLPPAAAPRTLRDAQAKRAAEKAQQQEAASAQSAPVPAAEAPAAQQQPAPAAPAGAAPAAAVAQPAPVAAEPAGAPKPGEKWHYRSSEAGTPMREIPAERMQDAREVSDLVPGLRFLAHRDMGDGKTWSVTERNTGLTLTTGHTTADLADFAARQRVQQVGADKVQARVRETLQKSGLSEGEALGATAEPPPAPNAAAPVSTQAPAQAGATVAAAPEATEQTSSTQPSIADRRAAATLDKQVRENGEFMTRRQWVERKVASGLKPVIKQEDRIKPMTRMQFFRATNEEQRAHEKRIKEAGKKDVYWLGDYEVTKTEHDLAVSLLQGIQTPAAAAPESAPATPTDPVAKRRAVLQALRDCIAG